MNKLLSSALLLLTTTGTAQAAPPVGTFGHEFTSSKHTPVWSVQPLSGAFKILSYGDGKKKSAHSLSPSERGAFWAKMDWPLSSSGNSECIGTTNEIFCYVPSPTRHLIPDLRSQTSDFFHFDSTGGLIEIAKISNMKAK